MTMAEIMEIMGFEHPEQFDSEDTERAYHEDAVLVHFQPGYPLKSAVVAARMGEDGPELAITDAAEYGDPEIWNESEL